ncbi:NADH:flavin oxidoreductase [Pseudarthrobacter enclensis]|uniref:2,4-dienoyl-CoA reductase-like NADH-dependent reductase (Old Yellow Enzyme family) n=1 Tax=Pseudarthrobacter enclensis TaxID=993070 RepID=A0ABT9RXK4_9MICC|nr:NADH:flavin oxidoreductase [Pseudarthrobacter enclensis]MDP9889541.1 2,4-dienoyl-CoA reductase-like NADH-dependent reductase (Old Yellow Enzyme family) [Pseudarthrobacter enclensis]
MPHLDPLWTPFSIGSTELPNRVALAPMTRVSATEDGHATGRMASYYSRFAAGGFGLLITEGIYTDTTHSQGYLFQPGLATTEQAESWAKVVDAVHARGSRIFAQLMHAGAQSQGNRFVDSTLGPSAVAPKGEQLGFYRGEGPYRQPQEATTAQLDEVREGFVNAALNAKAAGFDGVEIHGANGYLLDQFLTDYLNQRTDQYGGKPENRVRLAVEVSRAVRDAVGPDMSVGIRVSQGKVSDYTHKWAGGADEAKTIFTALAATGIDYIHTTEYRADAPAFGEEGDSLAALAKQHAGLRVIANGSLDEPEAAAALIADGQADVIALGKAALATRDWPRRARSNDGLDELDGSLFSPVADVKDWELEQTA